MPVMLTLAARKLIPARQRAAGPTPNPIDLDEPSLRVKDRHKPALWCCGLGQGHGLGALGCEATRGANHHCLTTGSVRK